MHCTVEDCEEDATNHYTWAWGEEGACCDGHRSHLESKAAQLGRSISFAAASDTDRPPAKQSYSTPKLQRLDPELGKLRLSLAEAQARIATLEQTVEVRDVQIVELNRRLMRSGEEPPVVVDEALPHAATTPGTEDAKDQKRSQRK